jgi:hypothetical protein
VPVYVVVLIGFILVMTVALDLFHTAPLSSVDAFSGQFE